MRLSTLSRVPQSGVANGTIFVLARVLCLLMANSVRFIHQSLFHLASALNFAATPPVFFVLTTSNFVLCRNSAPEKSASFREILKKSTDLRIATSWTLWRNVNSLLQSKQCRNIRTNNGEICSEKFCATTQCPLTVVNVSSRSLALCAYDTFFSVSSYPQSIFLRAHQCTDSVPSSHEFNFSRTRERKENSRKRVKKKTHPNH